jgi:hypothetical protein
MSAAVHNFAVSFESARVDRDSGIIHGVAVITEGPAMGHGMSVDATTLAQVKTSAETYKNGLKVKMTHGGDAGDIIGFINNFRIDGKTLRGDFNLLKSYEKREYVMELAESIPDTFGMSISFSGPDEVKGGKTFARCVEIYSCDLVAEPAANPSGLFSAGEPDSKPIPSNQMTPEEIKSAVDSALSSALEPMLARLSKLEASTAPEDAEKAEEAVNDKLSKVAELAALSVIKQFNLGAPAPAAASAPATPPAPAKKFEEVVRELKSAGKSHNAALREAMDKHPDAHRDYSARVSKGEVIMF